MSAGMRTRDKDGNVLVDMTTNFSLCTGVVRTNKVGGLTTIPPTPPNKKAFYVVSALEDGGQGDGKSPGVTINGTVLSWTYNYGGTGNFPMNCDIYYGYY